MNILNHMISDMNKEELRFFKIFLSRTNENDERKDIALFDLIRAAADKYDEDKIFRKLYPDGNKNAFYRLKNRLISDISASLFLQHFSEDDDIFAMYMISQAKYYFTKNHFDVSFYFLDKAEQKACKTESLELLNHIYSEMIKLSHFISDINPEEYILKRKKTVEQIKKINQINDIIAIINYRLSLTDSLKKHNNSILSFIQHTIDEFCSDIQLKNSNFLKQKIYEVVPKILLDKSEYQALELYLLTTYLQFNEDNVFNQKNHEMKLQMLSKYIQVMTLNKKYDRSLSYCQKLYATMEEFNGLYFEKYIFDYYHALIKNYIHTDPNKAIDILEKLKTNKSFRQLPSSSLFIFLNLTMIYFSFKSYNKALDNINCLYMSEEYNNTDSGIKFSIALTELIIRYELKDFDFIIHLTKQIEKDYKTLLDNEANNLEKEFLAIISQMVSLDNPIDNKLFQRRVKNLLNLSSRKSSDSNCLINFYSWLSEKYPA